MYLMLTNIDIFFYFFDFIKYLLVSNLIFFLSWFSESSYLNWELEFSLMVSFIDLLVIIALVLEQR